METWYTTTQMQQTNNKSKNYPEKIHKRKIKYTRKGISNALKKESFWLVTTAGKDILPKEN